MSKLYNLKIDFMRQRFLAYGFSGLLILISLISFATQGLRLGLDFTGGTLVELSYSEAPNLDDVRGQLVQAGHDHFVVQNFGSSRDVIVRLGQSLEADIGNQVLNLLNDPANPVELKRAEFVGAQVGEELRDKGGLGILASLICVMIYIAFRFQFKFALGTVLSTAHDVIIVVGIFSLFQIDFDLPVLAATLAVLGYSLNDTIVIYDRIRENFRMVREGSIEELINISINQTLARTVVTSLSTLLVLFALLFFGGEMLRGFAIALIVGVVVGNYSSVYIGGALLLNLKATREDLAIPVKEGVLEDDGRP